MSCIHVTVTAALMRIPRVRHMNMTRFGAAMNGRSLSRYLYNTHLPNESLVALDEHEHAWYVTGRAEGCSRIPDCVFLTSLLRSYARCCYSRVPRVRLVPRGKLRASTWYLAT